QARRSPAQTPPATNAARSQHAAPHRSGKAASSDVLRPRRAGGAPVHGVEPPRRAMTLVLPGRGHGPASSRIRRAAGVTPSANGEGFPARERRASRRKEGAGEGREVPVDGALFAIEEEGARRE